jgi:mannose-6-phosphate isomerase
MPAMPLSPKPVETVWGAYAGRAFLDLPPSGPDPIGEIWFEDADDSAPLLAKFLFTSERLSVQVHPDDAWARRHGYRCGKDELWIVLDAEPGAEIGLGLKQAKTRENLRRAAQDGTITGMMNWVKVAPGDVLLSRAGTVHAIGAGLTLLELQQNLDLTFRLYDHGRGRALHLEQALEVVCLDAVVPVKERLADVADRPDLTNALAFQLRTWEPGEGVRTVGADDAYTLFVNLGGTAFVDGTPLPSKSVWRSRQPCQLDVRSGRCVTATAKS